MSFSTDVLLECVLKSCFVFTTSILVYLAVVNYSPLLENVPHGVSMFY